MIDAISVIKDLREAIKHAKEKGQQSILIDNLNTYLDTTQEIIENAPENYNAKEKEDHLDKEMQQNQKKFENDIAIANIRSLHSIEMFKSVIESGLNAIKTSIILNGGAAIAILAFIGDLIKESPNSNIIISSTGKALLVFMFGAGLSGLAMGSRYLSQFFYSDALEKSYEGKKDYSQTLGQIINILSIALTTLSFLAFFYGGSLSSAALIK
jgi:hypothetical protein